MYYDTYLGGERFAGEEALWIADVPYWSMNYVGRVTGSPFSGDFLKEALLHVPEDAPYRGPALYENCDYVYSCSVEGEFDWFQGKERHVSGQADLRMLFPRWDDQIKIRETAGKINQSVRGQ